MLLERYYDESLAQASYLIGCERAREAIVIDPNRDVEHYLRAAQRHRVQIRAVSETHVHADYLSGSRDLARATNATLMLSAHGGEDWGYRFAQSDGARLLHDGEHITLGTARLDVMHTPGHTPEHIVFLVTDRAAAETPMGMVSGDFIFVGDVGRPDLLERAAKVSGDMERSARELFASIQKARGLADYLQIWPGHGAGSACGKALGMVPQSSLGYEKLYNPAFQLRTEREFVQWVLADQPEPPPYFATMKRLNRDGPPPRDSGQHRTVGLQEIDALHRQGAWIVDIRRADEFAAGHYPGAVNIPVSKSFVTYAGTALTYDRPIVLIGHDVEFAASAAARLALIGMDDVAIATPAVLDELRTGTRPVESLATISASALADRMAGNGVRVVDVRGRSEWNEGHIRGATHIYLGELLERKNELRHDEPIIVHCESGTRSSIGASLLRAQGFTNVTNFPGGVLAWRKAGLPLVQGDS